MDMKKFKKAYKSIFLVALIIFSITTPLNLNKTPTDIFASSVSDLNKKQDEIKNKLATIKREKEQLSSRSATLEGELAWLNTRTTKEREQYETLVDELNDAYEEVNSAIEQAQIAEMDLEKRQGEFANRLQVMFETRNKGTLEILFNAQDLSSFMANMQIVSIIAESDRQVIEELDAAKDEAYIKRAAAKKYSEDMEIYVEQKNEEIENLKQNISNTQNQIGNVKSELSNVEKEEKELLAQSNKIADEIKKLQTTKNYYGGTIVWPTPGNTHITSPFGSRFLFGYWSMHNGVDIGAPFNSKIVAAADGKVIARTTIPGYNSSTGNNYGGGGYGNYLVIDHGGGISTVYAHAKLLRVSLGADVKAGQWIADIGSTGTSTGPHLHFEVRENGTPVNPLQKKYLGVR